MTLKQTAWLGVLGWIVGCLSAAGQPACYVGPLHDTKLPALVTVETGGAKLDFIFDTGANLLLFNEASPLQLGGKREADELINANGTKTIVKVGTLEKLMLGSQALSKMRAFPGNVALFSEFMGIPCAGVFPAAVLEGSCSFDFDRGELKVFAAGFENASAYSAAYPFTMKNGLPGLTFQVEQFQMALLIDTGSTSCFALSRKTVAKFLRNGVVEMDAGKGKSISVGELQEGVRRGWFLKGSLMGKDLHGVGFDMTDGEEHMGMAWLMGFNFVIDFKSHKLLAQKRASPVPPIPNELMTGAVFRYTAEGLIVERLKPGGGAAEAAGLKPRDRLAIFGGTSLAGIDGYAFTALLRRHAGSPVPFTVYKAGSTAPVQGALPLGGLISEWDFAGHPAAP